MIQVGLRVVVVAYRADEHLAACLSALGRPDIVTVVDNGRSASTRAIVEAAGAAYVAAPGNVGFARAVNVGLKGRQDDEDVLLLNPDARISFDDVLRLQKALRAMPRVAAVGPRLVDELGQPQAADWPMPSPLQVWADAIGLGRRIRGPRFVTGAVLLLNGEALRELGGLDERYFLYAEESDWQLAAQRAGWGVNVVLDVTATHVGAASSSDGALRAAYFHRSGRYFARKWYGRTGSEIMRLGSVVAALRRLLVGAGPSRRDARRTLQLLYGSPIASPPIGPGRVVHVVRSDGFAGVERYIVEVVSELVARGWQAHVIGGDPRRMRAELPDSVSFAPAATTPDVLRALWRAGRCDILHAHMTAAELPSALLKRRTGGKLISTRHFAARRGSSLPARLVGELIGRRLDRQIAISQFVADNIEGDSVVVHNGIADSHGPRVRQNVIAVVQRWESEKHTAVALRAWQLTGLADEGWRMALYGRGAEEQALRALAAELGIADSVDFVGFVDDVRARLASASIMLATAPAEPFGLAVVEAMAEGTPVVAVDGGAHRETISESDLLFAATDVVTAATLLKALALSPESRRQRGDTLRLRQSKQFSVRAHVDRLVRVYNGEL